MSIVDKWIKISKRTKKILVTSTQYPFYGGAATNAYALIKTFREYGYKTGGIFFTQGIKQPNIDPDNIGGIVECKHVNANTTRSTKNFIINYLEGNPDIIFSKNYYAPIVSRSMFGRNVLVIYLVAGSPQMSIAAKKKYSAIRYIWLNTNPIHHQTEKNCVNSSDIVIPNNVLGYKLLRKNYGNLPKIVTPIDTSIAMNVNKFNVKPFEKREYDICFSCSHLDRTVKNPELALKLMGFPGMEKYKKVVIGHDHARFSSIKNMKRAGFIGDNKKVLDIMNNSKVVICPSYYDASPNVIKEAILCGCNFLLSKNCGWSEKYPDEFVCADIYDFKEWVTKLEYLINNNVEYVHKIESNNLLEALHLKKL